MAPHREAGGDRLGGQVAQLLRRLFAALGVANHVGAAQHQRNHHDQQVVCAPSTGSAEGRTGFDTGFAPPHPQRSKRLHAPKNGWQGVSASTTNITSK